MECLRIRLNEYLIHKFGYTQHLKALITHNILVTYFGGIVKFRFCFFTEIQVMALVKIL